MSNERGISRRLSRRELLRQVARAGVTIPLSRVEFLARLSETDSSRTDPSAPFQDRQVLSPHDDSFLEDLERAGFLYFWEQANPDTGMVKDRWNVRSTDNRVLGSIAATGFGLTALCIGEKRGYISYAQARERALATLRFLWKKLAAISEDFSITGQTSTPAKGCGNRKCLRSTPPFSFAAFSLAANISCIREIERSGARQSSTASTGNGFPKTP